MANIDRANHAIDNIISALYELKEALAEEQEITPIDLTPPDCKDGSYEPEVIISDVPPLVFNPEPEAAALTPEPEPLPEPVPAPIPIPAPAPAPAQAPAQELCFCGSCGMKLRPGARFCANCGTPV